MKSLARLAAFRRFSAFFKARAGGFVLLAAAGWWLAVHGPHHSIVECASMSVADCFMAAAQFLDEALRLGLAVWLALLGVVLLAARAAWLGMRAHRAVRALPRASLMPRRLRDVTARWDLAQVTVLSSDQRVAFCAGMRRPRLYISSAAVSGLSDEAILAVLTHEQAHAQRRDPLWQLLARAGADVLFFLPVARWWHEHRTLVAELAADRAAVARCGAPALAEALLHLAGAGPTPVDAEGIAPMAGPAISTLDARIAALTGPQPGTDRRAPLGATTTVVVSGLLASAVGLCLLPFIISILAG